MKAYVLIFFIILFPSISIADNVSFSGTIKLKDGTPVSDATVVIKKLNRHSLTDVNGDFVFLAVDYGKYDVEVISVEIQNKTFEIDFNSNYKPQVLFVKSSDVGLEEVVVNAKTKKRDIETKGFAATVIDVKESSLQSIQTNELLGRAVGVRIRQNGGMGSAVDYNLNGMSGNSVRIFIDGIPISTYGESFSLNSIPPSLIEDIEIYKGVIPAHLSDDALGGAINVILKKGRRNAFSASISYGSFNTQQANFTGMFRDKKTGLTVKASGFYNYSDNDYEIWGRFVKNINADGTIDNVRVKRFNDAYRSVGGRLELGFSDVKWADQFFVGYNGSDSYNEIQHGTYMTIPYKGRHADSEAHVLNLNYRKRDLFLKGLEFTVNGMYSYRKQVVTDTVSYVYNWYGEKAIGMYGDPIKTNKGAQQGPATLNHIKRNILTARTGLNYAIHPNHKIILNYIISDVERSEQDFMKSKVEREFVERNSLQKNITSFAYELKAFDIKLTASLLAKYYQQDIKKIKPTLKTIDGEEVKVDEVTSSNKDALGYGFAASYYILPKLLLMSSAEKAVRLPSENEVFGSAADNIVENIGLRAEMSNNLNVGFKAGPFLINKHNVEFSGSVFIRDTKDKITREISPNLNDAVQTAPFENVGRTKSQGFEAELIYNYGRKLNVVMNVSKFNLVNNMKEHNGQKYGNYKERIPNEPYFSANGMIRYSVFSMLQKKDVFNLFYNCGYVHSFYINIIKQKETEVPDQIHHNIGISYAFPKKKFVLSFDAKNIFDAQVYDNFGVQKPGRAFYLKLNYTINQF